MGVRLGAVEIGMGSYYTVADTVTWARAAEASGISRFWLAENYYGRTVTVLATAVALATRSIGIGLGVLNWHTRSAPVIAMEAATLDDASGGRITLGLGTGRTPASHLGLPRSAALPGLAETLAVCRGVLGGGFVEHEGQVYRVTPGTMRLGFPTPRGARLPIYLAGMGPRTLRLAAERADGVFLDVLTSPGFVRGMRGHVESGLAASGRRLSDVFFGAYAVFAVDRDGRVARDLVRPTLVDYLRTRMVVDERMALAGITPDAFAEVRADLQRAWARGGMQEAVRFVPDWVCDRLTVSGTPDECCARLLEFAEAGLGTMVLYNVLGRDPVQAIRLIAEAIVPAVTG